MWAGCICIVYTPVSMQHTGPCTPPPGCCQECQDARMSISHQSCAAWTRDSCSQEHLQQCPLSSIHPCHGTGSRKDDCMSSSPGLTRSVSVHLFVLYISSGPSNMFSADKNVSAMGLCRKVLKICTLLALEKDLLHFQSIYNLHIYFVKIVFSGLPSLIIADRFRYIYYQRIELTVSICFI